MLFSYQTGYIMWHSRLMIYIPFDIMWHSRLRIYIPWGAAEGNIYRKPGMSHYIPCLIIYADIQGWRTNENFCNELNPFLIPFRIVGRVTKFIFICCLMAPTSSDIKSVNHKLVTWHAGRPYGLYFIKSLFKEKLSSQVLQHAWQFNMIKLKF